MLFAKFTRFLANTADGNAYCGINYTYRSRVDFLYYDKTNNRSFMELYKRKISQN